MGLTTNGGIRVLMRFGDLAAEAGHRVTFYIPKGLNTHVFRAHKDIQVKEIGPKVRNKLLSWLFFMIFFPLKNRGNLIIVSHFFVYFPSVIARNKERVIYLVQGIEFYCYKGLFRTVAEFISRRAFLAEHLYAGNRLLFEELGKYGSPKGHLTMGIDSVFLDTPLPSRESNSRPYDIIYFLRREKYKRRDRFERILPGLLDKGYKVVCVTQESSLIEEYEKFDVTIIKPAGDAALIKCIDSARVLAYTSDYEGFALPPLECMARGVPSVMYDCGGPRNYAVNGENAVILENTDSAPLLDSIELVLGDQALYKKLSDNSFQTAQRHAIEPALRNFLERITVVS